MLRLRTCSILIAFTLAVSACGGGGGGNSPAPAPTPVQVATITAQPASAAVASGQAVTFTVTASGDALGYQWQRDGKDILGATAASYALNNVQASDDGASFTVVVRNSAGSVTSAAAILKVTGAKGLSLLAGGLGGSGNLDGADGRFALPGVLAMSPAGLLYVADNVGSFSDTGARRTVDIATGAVATVTGQPLPGQLVDMVFDGAGNRYELNSTAIYKTTPAGQTSLLAGAGQAAYVDGAGANARFGRTAGLAIDAAGNLYVTDAGNQVVRKVTPAGEVSTLAGTPGTADPVDGSAGTAHFRDLSSITVDRAGNVYVLDVGTLRKLTPAGMVTTIGLKVEGQSGPVYLASASIAADAAGNVYASDNALGCRIRRVAADGTVTDFAGKAASFGSVDGKGEAARFGLASVLIPPPRGFYEPAYELTADAQGNVYVGESDRIRKVSSSGAVTTLPGAADAAAGTVYYGSGLAFDGSRLAVSNGVITRIDANGALHFLAGQAGVRGLADGAGASASFSEPNRLIMDGLGNVYLQDNLPVQINRVIQRRIAADGTVTTLPQDQYAGLAWYADRAGNVWVAKFDGAVVRIAPDGRSTVVRAAAAGSGRGLATAIAVDRSGNLYVAEAAGTTTSNKSRPTVVRKITPAGAESVVAGSEAWSGVRPGSPGSLGAVDALAAGEDGALYIMSENTVLRLVL